MIAPSRGALIRQPIWNAPSAIGKEPRSYTLDPHKRRSYTLDPRKRRFGSVFAIGFGCSLASSAVTPTQQLRKRHTALVAKAEPSEDSAPGSASQDAEVAPGDHIVHNPEESALNAALSGADLTDSEAREQAFDYLSTRSKLKEELHATEIEFERLAVVMADPGAAMELNDRRVEMEEELESMREREQELAELMSEVRGVCEGLLERREAHEAVQRELGKTKDEKNAALEELQSREEAMVASNAELQEAHAEISSAKGKLQELQAAIDTTRGQLPATMSQIEELKILVAEKQEAADVSCKELSDFKLQIDELQNSSQQLEAKAKFATEELDGLDAKKLSLEAALKDAKVQYKTLISDIVKAKDSAKDLPVELDTITKAVEELQQEASEWKAKVAPQEAEVEQRRAEQAALLRSVEKLKARHDELESQIDATSANVDELSNEEIKLKAEIEELTVSESRTSVRRDQQKESLVALKEVRDSLQLRVDELVKESEHTRTELRQGARKLKMEWKVAKTGSALQEERRLLDATATEVLEVANSISDSQHKAQMAFQQALKEREIAEAGFAELQVLMEERNTRMKALEKMMMDSLSEDERARDRMDKYAEGVRASTNDLTDIERATEEYSRQVDEKSEYDAVDNAVAAGVDFVSRVGNILGTASKGK